MHDSPEMTAWVASFLTKNKNSMNTFLFNFNCHIYIKFHKLPGYKLKYEIVAVEGNDQFPAFILPKHGITASASTVNKLSIKHGVLCYDGMIPCLLMMHNPQGFDVNVICDNRY